MTAKGRGFGVSDSIPPEIRPQMGTRIHGCDRCQEACPRNKKKLDAMLPSDEFLERIKAGLTLPNLLHLPAGFYESHIQPVMYNYIRDLYLFQRNAAVAMGNTHDPQYLPDLAVEINHEQEAVRSHVAWALGQIGGDEAHTVLNTRLAIEDSPEVRAEIEQALELA
jgi:epoxyqueuosine reductase